MTTPDRRIESGNLKVFFDVECQAMHWCDPWAYGFAYMARRVRTILLMLKKEFTEETLSTCFVYYARMTK